MNLCIVPLSSTRLPIVTPPKRDPGTRPVFLPKFPEDIMSITDAVAVATAHLLASPVSIMMSSAGNEPIMDSTLGILVGMQDILPPHRLVADCFPFYGTVRLLGEIFPNIADAAHFVLVTAKMQEARKLAETNLQAKLVGMRQRRQQQRATISTPRSWKKRRLDPLQAQNISNTLATCAWKWPKFQKTTQRDQESKREKRMLQPIQSSRQSAADILRQRRQEVIGRDGNKSGVMRLLIHASTCHFLS